MLPRARALAVCLSLWVLAVSPLFAQVANLDQGSLNLGSHNYNTTSPAQTVTLSNTDAVNPLSVTSVAASGDFSISGGTCPGTPFTLVDTGITSCTIDITFTPQEGGSRAGNLTVDTDANDPTTSLSGTGLAVAFTPPTLSGDGSYTLQLNGSTLELVDGVAYIETQPLSATSSIAITGSAAANDHLTINFTGWTPIATTFAGGTGGNDQLTLSGGTFTTITHAATNANDGSINVDGTTVGYTGLEPVFDNLSATNRVFTFNGGAETITLGDDAGAGNGLSLIDSDLSESITFTNPSTALTVNGGTGIDAINVNALDSGFNATVTINGDAANDVITLAATTGSGTFTLNGNAGNDGISITGSGLTATVNGGDNTDTLTGPATSNVFSLTGSGSGTLVSNSVGSIGYSNIENLTGGTSTDTFTISGGSISGSIDGAGGTDGITGNNGINAWSITAGTSGTVTGVGTSFSNIENLTGGTGNDTFTFDNGAVWGSSIDGGNGTDVLDLSAYTAGLTLALTGAGTTNGFDGTVTAVTGGFSNINNLIGTGATDGFFVSTADALSGTVNGSGGIDTFTGNNIANTWVINAADGGTLNGLGFSNIENLTGGTSTDDFTLSGGSLSGAIDGASNTDSFTGNNGLNAWSLTGSTSGTVTGITGGFSNIENLTGGTGDDTFSLSDGVTWGGSIDGSSGSDAVNFSAYTTGVSAVLTNQGASNGFDGTVGAITGGFDNINSLTGGSGTDDLTGDDAASTWTIPNDSYNDGSVTLTFTAFEIRTGGSANDAFTVQTDQLGSGIAHTLNGGTGNDTFTLNFADGTSISSAASTLLTINGGDPASSIANRDAVVINVNNDTGTARTVGMTYASNSSGDIDVSGLGSASTIDINTVEFIDYNGASNNNDALTITGTASADDLTVTPAANAALVYLNGTPFATPGVVAGTSGPDLDLAGLASTGGLLLDGTNPTSSPGDEIFYNADGGQLDANGVGAGTITKTGVVDVAYQGMEEVMVNGTSGVVLDAGTAQNNGGADTFVLSRSGSALNVTINGTLAYNQPYSEVTSLTINGSDDDDTFTFTFGGGAIVPSGGLTINGGNQTTSDAIVLNGTGQTSVTHTFTNANDGSFTVSNGSAQTINYVGFEPITDNLSVADRVFTFNGGTETIAIGDDSGSGNGVSFIDSDLSESVAFTNPTTSLTVNGGTGVDTITLNALDSNFSANVTINGDAEGDVFTINAKTGAGTYTIDGLAGNDTFTLNASNVTLEGGSGDDGFTINAASLTATIDGEGDTDTVTGPNASNVFTVSSGNGGSMVSGGSGSVGFSNIENLTGNADADAFTLSSGGTLGGAIDGAGGTDTLTGDDVVNTWTITAANGGTVTGITSGFSNIENLVGGSNTDAFTLDTNGTLTGTLSGGSGGTDTLTGKNAANAWDIGTSMSGTVTSIPSGFSNIDNLVGGTNVDTFDFDGAETWAGSIDGGAGVDALDFAGYGTALSFTLTGTGTSNGFAGTETAITGGFDNINDIRASSSATTDALTGLNAASTWSLAATDSYTSTNTLAFSNVETRHGGTGTNAFTIQGNTLPSGATHTLNGNTNSDSFVINIANGTSIPTGGTELVINGSDPANTLTNSDTVTLNDAGGTRTPSITYSGTTTGDIVVAGLGTDSGIDLNGIERFTHNGDGSNDDTVTVNGTAANDKVTVVPLANAANLFMNGDPFATRGVANSEPGPDLVLTGLTNTGGIVVNGQGETGSPDDQLFYDESGLIAIIPPGGTSGQISGATAGLVRVDYDDIEEVEVMGLIIVEINSPTAADGQADLFTIKQEGPDVEVLYASPTATPAVPETQLYREAIDEVGQIRILGSTDNDVLTIDFTGATPIPTSTGILFAAGDGTDSMVLTAGTTNSVTHTFTNETDGSIDVSGRNIAYTGLDPITDNLVATTRTFTFSGGNDTITFSDDADTGDNQSFIDSNLSEEVTFTHPTATLIVNTGDGTNNLTMNALDEDFAAALTLNGGSGVDTITLNTMDLSFDVGVTINGGDGADILTVNETMGSQAYVVNGDGGADAITTTPTDGTGSFTVNGGNGGDTINAPVSPGMHASSYTLNGNDANDTFNVTPQSEIGVTINGNDGTDTLDMTLTDTDDETITYTDLDTGTWSFGSGEPTISFDTIETQSDTPNLSLTFTITDFTMPFPGDLITFQYVIANLDTEVNVVGIDAQHVLPAEMSGMYVSNASSGSAAYTGGTKTIDWTGISIPKNSSQTLTLKSMVAVTTAGAVNNTASITHPDPVPANNTSSASLTIQQMVEFPRVTVAQAAAYWKDEANNVHPIMGTYQFGIYRGIPSNVSAAPRWANDARNSLPDPLVVNDVLITEANEIIISTWGFRGFYRSNDGGRTWTPGSYPDVNGFIPANDAIIYAIAESPVDNRLYSSSDIGSIYRSLDGGTTWDYVGTLPDASATTAWSLVADPINSRKIYAGTFGFGMYVSTDGAETWTASPDVGMGDTHVHDLEFDPADNTKLYAATSRGVFVTTDGGLNWIALDTGMGAAEVRSLAFDPDPAGPMFAATWGSGVFVIPDRTTSTTWAGIGLRTAQVNAVAYDPNTQLVLVATQQGAHSFKFDETALPVSTEEPVEIPSSYVLEQNYPNPFNPTTTLQFGLPVDAHVRLTIYDALGRQVAVVMDRRMPPGQHAVPFDAHDLTSGTYLYRLEAGGQVLSRTMTLLK